MALPQVDYSAGLLPQGSFDQVNRAIAQGGQGLLQAMLAKQQRSMKILDQFGDAVGGAINRSREDKKQTRDQAKEIFDRDMGLARKELDSFKVGSKGYEKQSKKIQEMQAKRDAALQAYDNQGFFSRDDSILNIGPEAPEIRADRLGDANRFRKKAEGIQKQVRTKQDEASALKSGSGILARQIAMEKQGLKDRLITNQRAFDSKDKQIENGLNLKSELQKELNTLKGPEDSERAKELRGRIKKVTKTLDDLINEQFSLQGDINARTGKRESLDEQIGDLTKTSDQAFSGIAEKQGQIQDAMVKAQLAQSDTSVPEGKFRSALTGELYDTADLKVDEARDFQINLSEENKKQKDEDKSFGLQLKAISEIQDPKDYETEINKIPDDKLPPDVKKSMILAHRQGVKTNSIDNVLKLKSVYGSDQKGFFNHVKTAVDADGNKLFPGLEGVTYTDNSQKSLTQTLITRGATTGSFQQGQIEAYVEDGTLTEEQADALTAINAEVRQKKADGNLEKDNALAIQAANVMGGQTLINEYIKQGLLPEGTQYDDSEAGKKKLEAYKMTAVQALVQQGDNVGVENLLKQIPQLTPALKDSIIRQSENQKKVLDRAIQLKDSAEARAQAGESRDITRLNLAIDAATKSGNMQNLRMEIMRAAESRAQNAETRAEAESFRAAARELRAEERDARQVENQTYVQLKDIAGPEAAYQYLVSVRPSLKNFAIGATDFEKLERSVRFKVSSGFGTITDDEATAFGVSKNDLQSAVDQQANNENKKDLREKLLRGTKFTSDENAQAIGFASAEEANNYIKTERQGFITQRLNALGSDYKAIQELQKNVGTNDGGVDFKSRIDNAKSDKADQLTQGLFDQMYQTGRFGSAGVEDAFRAKTSSPVFQELLKEGKISQKTVDGYKKFAQGIGKIADDKVLTDRRTVGLNRLETLVENYYNAPPDDRQRLKNEMIAVNDQSMLGLNIDSLITSNQASTALEREKKRASTKSALIEEQLKIIQLAQAKKAEKGELTQKDIKQIVVNLSSAQLRNPYNPQFDATQISKGLDAITKLLQVFNLEKKTIDETELD